MFYIICVKIDFRLNLESYGTSFSPQNLDASLDPEKLESMIVPQLGPNCNISKLMEKFEKGWPGSAIKFVLTKALVLYISDKSHVETERIAGIHFDDEMAIGTYYRNAPIIMMDDIRGPTKQTSILRPILDRKIADFLTQYSGHKNKL